MALTVSKMVVSMSFRGRTFHMGDLSQNNSPKIHARAITFFSESGEVLLRARMFN
jgi:hypothetical protein